MPYRIVEKSTGKIVAEGLATWREAEQKARPKARYEVQLSLREQAKPENDPAEVAATLREAFKDLGLSALAAAEAAQGRESSGDTLESSFRQMGLSESAAKIAAKGH